MLEGVTAVKLFLGGQAVQAGLSKEELIESAEERGVSVVLPSDNGLEVAGTLMPALPL